MLPFLIVPREELEKIFEGQEAVNTGFLCTECFTPVRHVTQKGLIFCQCDCYARSFDDLEKVKRLTAQIWLEYIQASAGRKCLDAAGNDRIINPAQSPNYDCWCPSCARDRKIGVHAFWVSPEGTYICTYGACKQCADKMHTLSEHDKAQQATLCEDRLLERYPSLHFRLPSDIAPSTKQPVGKSQHN
jgi:hypothetical protein